jgi:hypothetical protein
VQLQPYFGTTLLYHYIFRTPEYFWFSPITLEFEGFQWTVKHYEAIPADERGRRWSKVLGLSLGIEDGWLRYFDRQGARLPTPAEAAEQERQRAEQLAKRLRELGVDPDKLG